MLNNGRIWLNQKEAAAVDDLVRSHSRSDRPASFTRTQPGETGPIRVEIGRRAWLVSEAGNAKEVS